MIKDGHADARAAPVAASAAHTEITPKRKNAAGYLLSLRPRFALIRH
jgi:hypothetical protein